MGAQVRGQHLRADDRLGLQHQARRGQPGQRPECLQQQVRLGLVLAVGAHPFPQERRRVESQHVDAPVGQGQHGAQHGPEHRRVGVVQVPLVLVEARPHPAEARDLGEAARRDVGEYLGQGALVGVGFGAIRVDQVHLAVAGLACHRLAGPFVLSRGVVEHQVHAQGDAALVQVARQRLQIRHGADPRVNLVVVGHRVAAVALPLARPQQRHQVQVGDAQLHQVVQVLADPRQRAGEPVGVADIADHAGPLEPGRVDLPAAVEPPQLRQARGRRVQRVEHQLGSELVHVHHAAVDLAERPGDVEGQRLEPRQERVGLRQAEPRPRFVFHRGTQFGHARLLRSRAGGGQPKLIVDGDDSRAGRRTLAGTRGRPEANYRPGRLPPIRRLSRRISVSRASSTGSMTFIAAWTAVSGSPGMP